MKNIAVIGATGSVGSMVIRLLEERNFPVNQLFPIGTKNKTVSFKDKVLNVEDINSLNYDNIDIIFSCVESNVVKRFINNVKNSIVIDKSSLFRLDPKVPLIIPEINGNILNRSNHKIISNPNCCVIPLATVLKPLDDKFRIKKVYVSTYQSTSGAGKTGMDELFDQTKAVFMNSKKEPSVFQKRIAFNIIPQIGDIEDNDFSEEENKIIQETQKIVGNHFDIFVTSVRVPVFIGHSLSVNIEFESDVENPEKILKQYTQISDITPIECVGDDEIFVSRIRSNGKHLALWVCTDNLRKGAALNGIQIAEMLI